MSDGPGCSITCNATVKRDRDTTPSFPSDGDYEFKDPNGSLLIGIMLLMGSLHSFSCEGQRAKGYISSSRILRGCSMKYVFVWMGTLIHREQWKRLLGASSLKFSHAIPAEPEGHLSLDADTEKLGPSSLATGKEAGVNIVQVLGSQGQKNAPLSRKEFLPELRAFPAFYLEEMLMESRRGYSVRRGGAPRVPP